MLTKIGLGNNYAECGSDLISRFWGELILVNDRL